MNTVRDNVPIEKLLRSYMDETEETDVVEEIKEEIIPVETKADVIKEGLNENKENKEVIDQVGGEDTVKSIHAVNKVAAPAPAPASTVVAAPAPAPAPTIAAVVSPPVLEKTAQQQQMSLREFNVDTSTGDNNLGVPSSIKKERENSDLVFSNIDNTIDTNGNESMVSAPKTIQRLEEISNINNEKRKLEEEEYDDSDEDDDAIKIGDNISLDFSEVNDLTKNTSIAPPPALNVEVLN